MTVVPEVVPLRLMSPVVPPWVPIVTVEARVGAVPKTAAPVPVSPVTAVIRSEEEKDPKTVALPVEVIAPVRLALVVTVAALPVVEPEEPETFPVTFPVSVPTNDGATTEVPKYPVLALLAPEAPMSLVLSVVKVKLELTLPM
jgi:hypothetical protein